MSISTLSRRAFLSRAASCGAHIAVLSTFSPAFARRAFAATPRARIVAQEPWGRLENIADGVWALISTPLQDRTTLCNGGIVRGRSGVLLIESFASPAGASWLAARARELTGRWPDDVVLTHFHGDHSNGLAGYVRPEGAPRLHTTAVTQQRVRAQFERAGVAPDAPRAALLARATLTGPTDPVTLDLGGRSLRIVPRDGHTPSDTTVELDDPAVVFCGDLVWNGMFPNYVDAMPSRLSRAVRALDREAATAYVPGHGVMANASALRDYIALLDSLEAAARHALERGVPAAEAAKTYQLPESLRDWHLFSPRYFEVALTAWERELKGG